jgi:hypothetical protein
MTSQGDPYRTLGLTPGASVNEIRSAYRRLAKRYHPDAAGERALPRFLTIQAAYEALVDANGDLRRWAPGSAPPGSAPPGSAPPGSAPPGSAPPPGSGGSAWRADPSRARASRDAWRARGRSGSPAGAGGPATPPGGQDGQGGQGGQDDQGGSAGPAGTTPGTGDRRPPGGHTEHHHRRHRRTATPGSTTYDEAGEIPLDPEWDGGTWYGASSGTYWTLNPREYADPRKHGPEYRRRAWRAAGQHGRSSSQEASAETPPAPAGPAPDAAAPGVEVGNEADTRGATPATPAHETGPVERGLGRSLPERLVARLLGRREAGPPEA